MCDYWKKIKFHTSKKWVPVEIILLETKQKKHCYTDSGLYLRHIVLILSAVFSLNSRNIT